MAEDPRPPLSRVRARLLLAAAPVLVVTGLLVVWDGGGVATDAPEQSRAATVVEVTGSPTPSETPSPPPSPSAIAASARGALPEAVVVPSLGVEARVSGIRLDASGALTPPSDPTEVGWWSEGARPGAGTGSAVLTGHTVHTGGGAFDDLEQLQPGDEVEVRTAQGKVVYDVTSVVVLGRGELARRNAEVFTQSGPGRLVLITCEDWDGTAYRSNVVVTARSVA